MYSQQQLENAEKAAKIRASYADASKKYKQDSALNSLIEGATEADRASIKLLENLDAASNGNLARLVNLYFSLKAKVKENITVVK